MKVLKDRSYKHNKLLSIIQSYTVLKRISVPQKYKKKTKLFIFPILR